MGAWDQDKRLIDSKGLKGTFQGDSNFLHLDRGGYMGVLMYQVLSKCTLKQVHVITCKLYHNEVDFFF